MSNTVTKKSPDSLQNKQKNIDYTIRIGDNLFKRIAKHLVFLKYLNSVDSKQQWIQEAIREKLLRDKDSTEESLDKFLHIKLDVDLWNDLEERVKFLRSTRISMSKKALIEEAIFEKLEREEMQSIDLLKNILKAN